MMWGGLGSADGWRIRVGSFDPARLRQRETIFTVGNGYLATRGAFEEGHPGDRRATFAHGVFDAAPGVFTELANLPDPLGMAILFDGDRFGLARGELLAFEEELDLRSAVLLRRVRWRSPAGRAATLEFERFASLDDPHLIVLRCTVTPEFAGTVEVRASIDGTTENGHPGFRVRHFDTDDQGTLDGVSYLLSRTRTSGITVATVMGLRLVVGTARSEAAWDVRDHPTLALVADAVPGRPIVVEKRVTIQTSRDEPSEGLVGSGVARLAWTDDRDELFARHAAAWQRAWETCDIEIDGDPEAQLAVRFNLFALLVAGPRIDDRVNIGAKTLSGFGYRGHAFWDTETFMLPAFTHTSPAIARNLLTSRWRQLGAARDRARRDGFAGARYPWESADTGDEVTPTWLPDPDDPRRMVRISTGEIEIHISADIAHAVHRYWLATGDDAWFAERGSQIVVATAAFWVSRAEWLEDRAAFGYRDVIGPDEYHEHVDNNAYTNRMARWTIRAGLETLDWLARGYPGHRETLVAELGLTDVALDRWAEVADRMWAPVRPDGIIEQFDGYLGLRDLDLEAMEPRSRSVQSLLGIDGVQETQAIKQPDVLMAMQLLPDEFSEAEVRANYAYYAPRTDHPFGSSLGPATMAVMACRAGQPEEAYGHFRHAALTDLADSRGNADDGIHGAAAGGTWQAVVLGFAGLRVRADGWETHPALPAHWRRLTFRFLHRGVPETVTLEQP